MNSFYCCTLLALTAICGTHCLGGETSIAMRSKEKHSTAINDHPYIAHILPTDCGGTVVGSKWIITDVKCTKTNLNERLTVLAGSSRISEMLSEKRSVKNVHEFKNTELAQDTYPIALLELSNVLTFGQNVHRRTLDHESFLDYIRDEKFGTVAGFGPTNNVVMSDNLLAVHLRFYACEVSLEDNPFRGILKRSNTICAITKQRNSRIFVRDNYASECQGFGGAGLIVNRKVVGVALSMFGCSQDGVPNVYASVSFVKKWIEEKMAAHF